MMECQFDTLIGVEDVPVLQQGPGFLVLLMQLRVDLAPHVSCLLYLQSQHLDQTLLGVYSTEYCIYVDQVGDWVGR
jgi:hypothetical protein